MMLRTTKTILNLLFFLFAASGFTAVFFSEYLADQYLTGYVFLIPTVLTAVYAFIVSLLLRDCYEPGLADHHIDSIYFLGFLYTLVSLITLFYRITGGVSGAMGAVSTGAMAAGAGPAGVMGAVPAEVLVFSTFYYLGISVSTSLAGVLLRNMVRGAYLRDHPQEPDNLEKSYELLSSIAESFSVNYRETFESVRLFLSEREENTKVLAEKENQYIESLERFIDTSARFGSSLTETEARLSSEARIFTDILRSQTSGISGLTSITGTLTDAAERIRKNTDAIPFEQVTREMTGFHTCVRELNGVLDSLISILEMKVERVR